MADRPFQAPAERGTSEATATAAEPVVPVAVSRAKARSRADWNRFSGFFSRQCRSTGTRAAASAPIDEGSRGSSLRIAVIVSAAVSRANARLPVSIS